MAIYSATTRDLPSNNTKLVHRIIEMFPSIFVSRNSPLSKRKDLQKRVLHQEGRFETWYATILKPSPGHMSRFQASSGGPKGRSQLGTSHRQESLSESLTLWRLRKVSPSARKAGRGSLDKINKKKTFSIDSLQRKIYMETLTSLP